MMLQLRIFFILFLCNHAFSEPGIITDGSLGNHAQGVVPSGQGHTYLIHQELGSRSGTNLFHSFSEFSIGQGESALFTGEHEIDNIFSRVTGDQATVVNGLLASDIEGADFYFINPNGVLFGNGSALSLKGAFYVSTANVIYFQDGGEFSTDLNASSELSISNIADFGFINSSNAVNGGITINNTTLALTENDASFNVIADIITLSNSNIDTQGGDINLGASLYSQAGTVTIEHGELSSQGMDQRTFKNYAGNITLNTGQLAVDGLTINLTNDSTDHSAANVSLEAKNIELSGASISVKASTPSDGGSIEISSHQAINIIDSQLAVESHHGQGKHQIVIESNQGDVAIFDTVITNSTSNSQSGTGDIDIRANQSLTVMDSAIHTQQIMDENSNSRRNATIDLKANEILINDSDITTLATNAQLGNTITVEADRHIIIEQGSQLLANSLNSIRSGNIRIRGGAVIVLI